MPVPDTAYDARTLIPEARTSSYTKASIGYRIGRATSHSKRVGEAREESASSLVLCRCRTSHRLGE
eukprot:239419-Rhodomonas_salina.2